ncbi:MAG: GAF domain-containing protein [Chloroflexota bacterium]
MSFLRDLHLRIRISLLAALGFTLTFAIMGWLGSQASDATTRMLLQERLNLARTIALHLDQELARTLSRLAQVASFPTIDLEDGDLEPEKAELRALYRPEICSYAFLLDREGLVLWTEPYLPEVVGTSYPECPQIQEALRTGQPAIACVTYTLTPQIPMVILVVPIRNQEGNVAGILGVAIDLTSPTFTQMLVEMAPGSTAYIQLVDGNGIILAHTEGKILQRIDHADLFISLLQEKRADITTHIMSEEGQVTSREVIAFAPLSVVPWGVAVEQKEADLLAPALETRRKMEILSAITLSSVFVLVWIVTGSVVAPLRKLVVAAQLITAGDLTTPVPHHGKDEIGDLAHHLEEMRASLAQWGEALETAVQQRTQRLSLLNHIAHALSTTLDLEVLLEIVFQEIKAVIETDAFFIALYDRVTGEMDFRIQVDRTGYEPRARRPLIPGLTAQVIQSRQPILIHDFEQEKDHLPPARLWGTMQAPRSWLGAPLLLGKDVVGVISVQAYRANAYGEAEQELLSTIADSVAVAIENARLYQETQERAARLAAINRVSAATSLILDLNEILNTITLQMAELFAVEHSGILMFDEKKEWGSVVAEYPRQGIAAKQFKVKGYLAAERIIADQKPLMIEDTLKDPLMAKVRDTMRGLGIKSMLIVPLVVKGETIGSIGLDVIKERRVFSQEEIELAQTIANQVCVAIENARLYEAEQRRAARLGDVLQLSIELTSLHEESIVLNTLVTRVAVLSESPVCTVMLVDEEADEAVLAAQVGLPEGTPLELRVPLAVPIIRRLLETSEPIILPDIDRDAPQMRQILVRRQDIRAFFAYPMAREGRTMGFITLSSLTPRVPSAEEVTAYRLLAERAAVALENARLYTALQAELAERERAEQELQERMRELERFNRLAVGRELKMIELKERIRELEAGRESRP